ncbi:putative NADH-quinone oxidoreductase subunit 5 [Alicyclobacillus hesperidum subsp. aegles]|uniref:NADH dehydrogenase subunit 5 n=1 Tax=Alicyclobacillus hesperidum TaxID=89784 RepID=UPI00222954F2|nr:NADH dehydrogenase subunit 5 [Alicyclobacillus hesperidum]GLG02309.1 putative NADH-quinone oxidoreductase subunit 5 [Alicyclobacillus hesperidum subsp. aegles]
MFIPDVAHWILPIWLCTWALVGVTGFLTAFMNNRTSFARWHVGALALLVLVAGAGLFVRANGVALGPWQTAGTGWVVAFYIALLGMVIQRFTIRYLHGDRHYGRYFGWLTWTTAAASMTWMSRTLWMEMASWLAMDAGLIALIALGWESAPVRAVTKLTIRRLAISALAIGIASFWYGVATHSGDIAISLARAGTLPLYVRLGVALLLVVAAVVQAGGWPFGRWLIESAVTPTPVSAIMHAGVVNAGGLLLTRWAPLFGLAGAWPHAVLLVLAWVSVGMGSGMVLVHADYKRQLVASTMAQMGLMLMQCAIGAYDAAIVHLILHGVFKATLFLRAGSALPHPEEVLGAHKEDKRASLWPIAMGGLFALAYYAAFPHPSAGMMSALMLGAGMALLGRQARSTKEGRWLGMIAVVLAAVIGEGVRAWLTREVLLASSSSPSDGVAFGWSVTAVALLIVLGLVGAFAMMKSETAFARRIYLWLFNLGEPRAVAMEAHPRHLHRYAKEAVLR